MQRALHLLGLLAPLTLLALPLSCTAASGAEPAGAGGILNEPRAWAMDPTWYDGLAEKAVYSAERPIYGTARTFEATAYTNKQRMDPRTTTKASGADWVEAFKHHWSERVPTETYDYDFSTATFLRSADLSLFKLTAATQEDCGASFKQVWAEGDELRWFESVYFPDAGIRSGTLRAEVVAEDALPALLRNFPFAQAETRPDGDPLEVALQVLPSQKSTRQVDFEARPATVTFGGRETVSLGLGRLDAYRLDVRMDGAPRASLWFAAEGDAPWLHVLVRYEDADRNRYVLERHERTAYWAR